MKETIAPLCTDNLSYTNPIIQLTRSHDLLSNYAINFQRIVFKQAKFSLSTNDHHPDIILGTQTWLKASIKSSEFIPHLFTTIRHNRNDGYGGVLVGVNKDLNVIEYTVNQVSDLVMCKILLPDISSLFLYSLQSTKFRFKSF